jgi:hypothetical protein
MEWPHLAHVENSSGGFDPPSASYILSMAWPGSLKDLEVLSCSSASLISHLATALILVSRSRYCCRSCLASQPILTFAMMTWRTAQTFTINLQTLLFVVLAADLIGIAFDSRSLKVVPPPLGISI